MADGDSAHVQRNLQAILKWSLQQQDEAGSATTAANSSGSDKTDTEQREWLREALTALSSQPSETDLLKAALAVLRAHSPSSTAHSTSCATTLAKKETAEQEEKVLEALEQVQYLVEDLDHACDLIPLQGVGVIVSYLHHSNVEICTGACHLVATATQNNPSCQSAFLSTLPDMLSLVNSASSPASLRTKALYAVSCLTRGHTAGLKELLKLNGLPMLLSCLDSGINRLVVKTLFLLNCYYSSEEDKVLLSSHTVTITAHLISLLSTPAVSADSEVFLQALSTLHVIIGGSRDAVLECRREEHHLRALCDQWLRNVENEDLSEMLRNIQKRCFEM